MVMICKLGESNAMASLIKNLAVNIYKEGGIVRRFSNMGDRISSKNFKSKDNIDNLVCRYVSVSIYIMKST